MITAKAFAGKHYAVYGLARSGIATVEALLASGARVTAWDSKPEAIENFRSSRAKSRDAGTMAEVRPSTSLGTNGVEFLDLDAADLTQFDSVVVTPGLPINRHPIAQAARAAEVEVIGDIELFARARPELPLHKVVGITGTNGKSTTTALIHHILKTAGVPTTMGGNIGLPILAQNPLPEGGVYVLELSSYQIDLTQSLDCDVAVLLNITPDHLDRYESFEGYAASKARLFEMQGNDCPAIINTDDALSAQIATRCKKRLLDIGGTECLKGQRDWLALQGPHNAVNAMAAIAVSEWLKVPQAKIHDGLRTYPGLPHRMERIREKDGVLFVNDSKATNAEAAAPALAAYYDVRWILGGQAKTESLGDTEAQLGHVVKAYTIGEAGPMFAQLLRDREVPVEECETLEIATKRAAEDSLPGDVVLLSPASASFDQFRDFEARGDRFRELVEGL